MTTYQNPCPPHVTSCGDKASLRIIVAPTGSRLTDGRFGVSHAGAHLGLMVPLFITKGEMIKVDTQERKYAGKRN